MKVRPRSWFATALAVGICAIALGDNAALTSGGQPKMMKEHPSISMDSEVVKLVVHWDRVDTDCSFVFLNKGPACTVNMGFPDFGLFAYAMPRKKPSSMFKQYQSYVDGRSVPTKLVLGGKPGEQWQTKSVAFGANGKRVVREVYTTEIGGVAYTPGKPWAFASYLLHTGASWKNTIGHAKILVTFAPDSEVATPLNPLYGSMTDTKPDKIQSQLDKPGGLVAVGPAQPSIEGRTLVFEKSNWRPTDKDDVFVGFSFPKKLMQLQIRRAHRS